MISVSTARCLLLLITLPLLHAQLPQGNEWNRADLGIVRLEPDAFRVLPSAIQVDLRKRGCTIPQPFTAGPPQNVISGHFYTAIGTDWAVLCSHSRTSSILVYRRGAPESVFELHARPDKDFLQVTGPGTIGYSRAIAVATPAYIREKNDRYGVAEPRAIAHEGINDLFIEKASIVWYYHEGRWLQLPGAD
jgi:hypothetical protein